MKPMVVNVRQNSTFFTAAFDSTLYLRLQLDIQVFKLFTAVANLADNEPHT